MLRLSLLSTDQLLRWEHRVPKWQAIFEALRCPTPGCMVLGDGTPDEECQPCPKESKSVEAGGQGINMQQAVHCGYYSFHGLKWLIFTLPDGLILPVRPEALRKGDGVLFWNKPDSGSPGFSPSPEFPLLGLFF